MIPNPKYKKLSMQVLEEQLVSAVGFQFSLRKGAIHFDNVVLEKTDD